MDSTGQQSASASAQQPLTTSALAMTQQSPNRVAQQSSAGQPMTPMSPQPAMMLNSANMVSPQQMPKIDQQVDWNTKIAEVMREQFGLRSKHQSVMYKTPYPPAYNQIPLPHKYKMPDFTKFSGQGEVSTMEYVNRFLL